MRGGRNRFLSKSEFGICRGKPVFLSNLLDLKRTMWAGLELDAGKHTIVLSPMVQAWAREEQALSPRSGDASRRCRKERGLRSAQGEWYPDHAGYCSSWVTHLQINAGGVASGTWLADTDFNEWLESSTTAAINTSWYPTPHRRRCISRSAAGERQFNVLINGTTVPTNFDVFAAAGGEDIAIVKSFTTTASSSGTISIQFAVDAADLPKVSGMELISQ